MTKHLVPYIHRPPLARAATFPLPAIASAVFLSFCSVLWADQVADSTARQPEVSSDAIRQELADLREQVRTLRSELAALKSALAAVQATAHSENRAVSAPLQESSKDLMPLLENVPPPSGHGQQGTAAPTHSSSSLAGAGSSPPTSKPAQGLEVRPAAGTSAIEARPQSSSALAELQSQQPAQPVLPKVLGDRVTLGGYGSMRFEANNVSPGNFIPGGSGNGFTFRRFVLTTEARLTPRLRIHSETEFERLLELELEKRATAEAGGTRFVQEMEGNAGAEITIEQIWGQYDFAENRGLRFGVVLPPLGRFNILHDDDYWDLPRRTLVDRDAPIVPVAVAWRELGAGLVGSFNLPRATRFDYQFYVLNGTTLNFDIESVVQTRSPRRNKLELESEMKLASGAVDGSQGARAVAWRTAFSPTLAGEVALSGYHGRYTPDFLSVREPLNSFGLDWKWRVRGFETEGEFIYTSLGRLRRVLDNLAATARTSSAETSSAEAAQLETEIALDVKNLARTRFGFWTDFKYHWRPQFLRHSFLGRPFEDPQIIPILRYERVWLNRQLNGFSFADGRITGLDQEDLSQDRLSLGINYRPVSQFGLQVAYEHNQRRKGSRLVFPAVPDRSTDGVLAGMTFAF